LTENSTRLVADWINPSIVTTNPRNLPLAKLNNTITLKFTIIVSLHDDSLILPLQFYLIKLTIINEKKYLISMSIEILKIHLLVQ